MRDILSFQQLHDQLEYWANHYNNPDFIGNDPISIPHQYKLLQDIEITAFWTAILSWGQRKTIINKANELFGFMDHAPYDFIVNHQEKDREKLLSFKHRTFQSMDTLYFLEFFQRYFQSNNSLESAFVSTISKNDQHIENGLRGFQTLFFDHEFAPQRTRKHVSSPATGSTCKRINMFLRWMVRKDKNGVDFGLWKKIRPDQLLMPLDVHVERQARNLGLLQRTQRDWQSVIELTNALKEFDPLDPVKYDFALFGMGINPESII